MKHFVKTSRNGPNIAAKFRSFFEHHGLYFECYYDHQVPGKSASGLLQINCSDGNVAPSLDIVLSLLYLLIFFLSASQ